MSTKLGIYIKERKQIIFRGKIGQLMKNWEAKGQDKIGKSSRITWGIITSIIEKKLKKKVEIDCNWKIKGTRTKKKKVEKFRDSINSIRNEIKKN